MNRPSACSSRALLYSSPSAPSSLSPVVSSGEPRSVKILRTHAGSAAVFSKSIVAGCDSLSPPVPDELPVVVEQVDHLVRPLADVGREQPSLGAVVDLELGLVDVRLCEL